ncbi:MAG TPA: helix-turn-helix domain-containing protein [Phycisphaerales bacterium]|nr:helix-turn-helix domain-containing protein [Phycisphaerales bacterium]
MAKMFYSLEEAAQRLGVTPTEVRDLSASGQLQEFRDREKLMFKVEQVDMLAASREDEALDAAIPLTDSGEASGIRLADDVSASGSGSAIGLEESPKERSGISIFDADQLDAGDPSAVTQVTSAQGGDLTVESIGSGSGLLDLTREADDTSLGADLLEGVYSDPAAVPATDETQGTSGLFETTGAASDVSGGLVAVPGGVLIAAEPFDPAGSGFAGGLALGVTLVAALALAVVLVGLVGTTGSPLLGMMTQSWPWMFLGIAVVVLILCAIVGWALGRRG